MRRRSMARNFVALAVAGYGIVAPCLASSAAPVAYHSALHTAMLVHPVSNSFLSQVWVSTGAGWSELGATPGTVPCSKPGGQCSGFDFEIAYDPLRRVVVGVGPCKWPTNDLCTWTWAGGATWTLVSSSGFSQTFLIALAYDPALGGTVLVASPATGYPVGPPATYLWNGSTWSLIATTGPSSAPGESEGALGYDAARREMVFVLADFPTQTWVLRGTTWVKLAPATAAPIFGRMAFDPAESVLIMVVSGEADETWSWDGSNWTQEIAPQSTSANTVFSLTNGISAVTYDTTRHAVIGLDYSYAFTATAVYTPLP